MISLLQNLLIAFITAGAGAAVSYRHMRKPQVAVAAGVIAAAYAVSG